MVCKYIYDEGWSSGVYQTLLGIGGVLRQDELWQKLDGQMCQNLLPPKKCYIKSFGI